jgi:hypothetical protein
MSNSNENKKEVQAWKDFQHKIIYIYEKCSIRVIGF